MISNIEVIEKEIGPVIEIEEKGFMLKMYDQLGVDYSMLFDYLDKNEVDVKEAMPYTHLIDLDWNEETRLKSGVKSVVELFTRKKHYFAGVSTGKMLPDHSRIVSDDYVKTECIHCTHTGPYKGVGETYRAMVQWAQSRNLRLRNEAFEFYLNSPAMVSQEDLRTEVVIPIN